MHKKEEETLTCDLFCQYQLTCSLGSPSFNTITWTHKTWMNENIQHNQLFFLLTGQIAQGLTSYVETAVACLDL